MNRRTLTLTLALSLMSAPACLFSIDPDPGQDNNATSAACEGQDEGACGGAGSANTCCGGTCVDTTSDPDHCGSCGFGCGEGQECFDGMCAQGGSSCAPAETLISKTNEDVAGSPRPLLVPVDDPIFSCTYLLPSCPLVEGYAPPPVDDASYIAFYGTSSVPGERADSINAVLVSERGEVLPNSRGFADRPGSELLGLRASSDAFGSQLLVLWRERSSLPDVFLNSELVLYDLPPFDRRPPGSTIQFPSGPPTSLLESNRIAAFDVVQFPIAVDDGKETRGVVFAVVVNPRGLEETAAVRVYLTSIEREGGEPFRATGLELVSEDVPLDEVLAESSLISIELGEMNNEEGDPQAAVFVAVSGPAARVVQGERIFSFNSFLIPRPNQAGTPSGELRPTYETFRKFGEGWTPNPTRYPADAYLPITLLQNEDPTDPGSQAPGGGFSLNALTTSSTPDSKGNGSRITVYPLSADARSDDHAIGDPFDALTQSGAYSYSSVLGFAPWFTAVGVLSWLEGQVADGVLGPVRSLSYAPIQLDGDMNSAPLGAPVELVRAEENAWVEAFDTAVGARSYGVLLVTKTGEGQASEARFRAISSHGQPICELGE